MSGRKEKQKRPALGWTPKVIQGHREFEQAVRRIEIERARIAVLQAIRRRQRRQMVSLVVLSAVALGLMGLIVWSMS